MAPSTPIMIVITFLVPSLRPLNFARIFPTNSTMGVTACKNALPTGTNSFFKFSMAFLNLAPVESSTLFNSRSDRIANSSIDAPARSNALDACDPSFTILLNNVEILANWNLPNSCSIALARFSGSSVSNALASPTTVPFKFPALLSTIPLMLIPRSARNSLVFFAGLIIEARPDLSALAPSEALIPPSFIAVIKNARSSTEPPSCFTTGPAFGIAIVKSSIERTVWFSTALRKLIFCASCSEETPKAFCKEIVVSSACCCSTCPRTESLVAWITCASRALPCIPIAAAVAAISIVSFIAIPYFVNSLPSLWISATALFVASPEVVMSP